MSPRTVAAGVDLRVPPGGLAWLHGRPGLVSGPARLTAWRIGEGEFQAERLQTRPLLEAPPDAAPLSTAGSFARSSRPIGWFPWREGTALVGMPTLAPYTARLDLGPELSAVVEPALGTRAGTLDVFALLDGPPRVARVLFEPPGRDGRPPAPRVVWTEPLPCPLPRAARATIGPDGPDGARREVVLAGDAPDGVQLLRLAVGPDGQPAGWSEVLVPGARLLPGGDGDLLATPRGVEARFPAVGDDGALLLVRGWWLDGPAGASGRGELLPTGASAEGALSAVARFGLHAPPEHYPVRVAWALLRADGTLLSSQAPRDPARLPSPPALPLELLPLASTWLVLDPGAPAPGVVALRPGGVVE